MPRRLEWLRNRHGALSAHEVDDQVLALICDLVQFPHWVGVGEASARHVHDNDDARQEAVLAFRGLQHDVAWVHLRPEALPDLLLGERKKPGPVRGAVWQVPGFRMPLDRRHQVLHGHRVRDADEVLRGLSEGVWDRFLHVTLGPLLWSARPQHQALEVVYGELVPADLRAEDVLLALGLHVPRHDSQVRQRQATLLLRKSL
mmetsp:Transcript_24705/g.74226  ORF Transcript_24705/g.74226 Transcript_24705/m.74226 type:complete len:202 (-) Transcript_24705:165-770(-)